MSRAAVAVEGLMDNDVVFSMDSAVKAGLIVVAARVGALSLGKAKQTSDVASGLDKARDRGIDVSDLFVSEDAETRWYLVGPWRAPKKGEPLYGDGRMSQEINSRVRYFDAKIAAQKAGVNFVDIEELRALYPTTPKKFIELRRRLREAGVECE